MSEEIWLPCPGYEWNYEVSSHGRVRSLGNDTYHRGAKVLKQNLGNKGYYTLRLTYSPGKKKCELVHRLIAKAFIQNPDDKPCVNHIDGNKLNNAVDNLEWATIKENNAHAVRSGLCPLGEEKAMSKLTWEDVQYIRAHHIPWDRNFGGRALARRFGVSNVTVIKILNNEYWKENPID